MIVTCTRCGRTGEASLDSERYALVVWRPRARGHFTERGEDTNRFALVDDARAGRLSCGYHGEVMG